MTTSAGPETAVERTESVPLA
ncbi:MAG: hypothetical protein RLZZ272_1299, partial [Actinomycetota bacterium]